MGKYAEAYAILSEINHFAPAEEKMKNFFYAPTVVQEGKLSYITGSSGGPQMTYEETNIEYDTFGNIKSIAFPQYNQTFNYIYDSKGNELEGYDLDSPNNVSAHHTNTYKNGLLSKSVYENTSSSTVY